MISKKLKVSLPGLATTRHKSSGDFRRHLSVLSCYTTEIMLFVMLTKKGEMVCSTRRPNRIDSRCRQTNRLNSQTPRHRTGPTSTLRFPAPLPSRFQLTSSIFSLYELQSMCVLSIKPRRGRATRRGMPTYPLRDYCVEASDMHTTMSWYPRFHDTPPNGSPICESRIQRRL